MSVSGSLGLNQLEQKGFMISLGKQKAVNSSKTYSNRSFKTNEDSHLMCHNCKTSHEDFKVQIAQLKEKAHQSFMQVLQIQQLHQEELLQVREEWSEKQEFLTRTVSGLQEELNKNKAEMSQLQKNVQRHSFDFEVKELIIDNIESIGCDNEDRSYLDESALLQFKELLTARNGIDYVTSLRREIYKDFKFISNNKTQIQKLFMVIKELQEENHQLGKSNQKMKENLAKYESDIQEARAAMTNMEKQNTFISMNLKRLGNDKLTLEKKVSELERKKSVENSMYSPTINRQRSERRQDSSEKTEKMLDILQQASELSISRKEVNQLNYAQFMAPDEVHNHASSIKYRMKKSTIY